MIQSFSMNNTLKSIIKLVVLSFFAGVMIGFGALCNLVAVSLGYKFIGSLLFSFGLFFVILFELKLFTGMVANFVDMKVREWYQLAICFLVNALGIIFVCALAKYSNLQTSIISTSSSIMNTKLNGGWTNALFTSILCGMLITISVKGYQKSKERNLSSNITVMLPVIVFVYLGLDHSVANWAYIYLSSTWTIECLIYVLLTIIGNIIGGILLPLGFKLIK